MYTMDYLELFAGTLGLPAESRAPLNADYARLLGSETAMREMRCAGEKLFAGAEWSALIPHMDAIASATGVHRHTVDFLFLMAQSEQLRADYDVAGLPRALFWDTIADLKYKLLECHSVYGIWGTFVAFWHPWFYTMRRFKLGRLQFEAVPFEGEAITLGMHTVRPGDTALNIHIPSSGEPFGREARLDAYRRAYDFYRDRLQADAIPFVCASWLLYPKNREILPETANIVDFMADFHLYKSEDFDVFHDCWRVFGKDFERPAAELPEDTSMRRCFKKWLLEGKPTGEGWGVFVFDGKNFFR